MVEEGLDERLELLLPLLDERRPQAPKDLLGRDVGQRHLRQVAVELAVQLVEHAEAPLDDPRPPEKRHLDPVLRVPRHRDVVDDHDLDRRHGVGCPAGGVREERLGWWAEQGTLARVLLDLRVQRGTGEGV